MTATPKNKTKRLELPNINLKELLEQREEILKERRDFIDQYNAWLKKHPQKKIVDKA